MPTAAQLKRHVTSVVLSLGCAALAVVAGRSDAGIQGSGFRLASLSVGEITAIDTGSVWVNGVEYSTAAANVHIDDQEALPSQLRAGQIVTVRGRISPAQRIGEALDIAFISDVRGTISRVDVQQRSFVVLGQTVRLSGDTQFGTGLEATSLEGLTVGTAVEVSAFPTAAGALLASRIDLAEANATLQVRGTVKMLEPGLATFRVNDLTVDFSGATVDGTLGERISARVEGTALQGDVLQATRVAVVAEAAGKAGEQGEFEGLITSYLSDADFRLGHQRVVADGDTRFVLHEQALGPDVPVKVRGTFDSSGALVASKIETKQQGLATVQGLVDSIDSARGTMSVLGVTISTTSATALEDASEQRTSRFGFADVRTGDSVEVSGTLESGALVAREIRLLHR
jgi:hypothetical protein